MTTQLSDDLNPKKNRRASWILAALLVLLTLGISAASRSFSASPRPVGPSGPNTVQFSAVPSHPVSFQGNLDRSAVLQGSDGLLRMELSTAADEVERGFAPRRPTDLIVVLDRSGSMAGTKMNYAHAAIRELVSRLGLQDRFALVSYANHARTDIPLAPAVPANIAGWSRMIGSLGPNGGTNMSVGLDLGLQTVDGSRVPGRVARVILISDGLANQGDSSHAGLVSRATRAARGEYVLSSVGVGDDFNESLMTALADAGTGNYYYLEGAQGLAWVFAGEFEAARATVASGLRVRIEPGTGVRVIDAAGYPLERDASGVSFQPGTLFSGQERRVWVTLTVPTHAGADFDLGRFSLDFSEDGKRQHLEFSEIPRVACVEKRDEFLAGLDEDAWGRSVVEEEYGALQKKVADYVREGRRELAVQEIDSYKSRNAELNSSIQSAPVAAQLEAADGLLDRVDESFRGADQEAKRKRASKELHQQAIDVRRSGAKQSPVKGGAR